MKYITEKKNCRLCNSRNLNKLFELCSSPLANNLALKKLDSLKSPKFPLNIMFCKKCFHVQLEHVVEASKLYKNYLYMTGISNKFKIHFEKYANEVIKRFKNFKNIKILEIGSNDCTLLDLLRKKNHMTVGIEPAKNLFNITKKRHTIINDFYNDKTNKILKKKFNNFDLVIANNVFAHIDNFKLVFKLLKSIIHKESLIVFEVSYLLDVLKKNLFDTIYHEHLDYHSLIPLITFFKKNNFKIIDAKKVSMHGGSIRLYIARRDSARKANNRNINNLVKKEIENGLKKTATFSKFHDNLNRQKKKLNSFFEDIKGEIVYGYGAPAKAVTLLNFFNLNHENIKLIIDDSPLKQKKYIPSSEIRIYNSEILIKKPPKYIVILAWNVYEDILKKLKKYRKIDYAIIPLPRFKIVKL